MVKNFIINYMRKTNKQINERTKRQSAEYLRENKKLRQKGYKTEMRNRREGNLKAVNMVYWVFKIKQDKRNKIKLKFQ